MKLLKWVVSLLFVILTACQQPNNPPPAGWQGSCSARMIVITQDGSTPWTDGKINEQVEYVSRVFKNSGMSFNFLPHQYLEDPVSFDLQENEYLSVLQRSKEKSDKEKELVIHLINKLFYGGDEVGGLAYYPSNLYGSIYQHGVMVSSNSFKWSVAHELGHSFGLLHSWEDDFTDTIAESIDDCDVLLKSCNIMSYCYIDETKCGIDLLTTPQQNSEVQKWATSYPRRQVVKTVSPQVIVRKASMKDYTKNTKPAINLIRAFK